MNEVWKDIEGYDGCYQVSNLGRVKSLERFKENVLSGLIKVHEKFMCKRDRCGYSHVSLCKNGIKKHLKVHRLVAIAFIQNPENKQQINHIDGNRKNNNVNNLEWATPSENAKHAFRIGLNKPSHLGKFGYNNHLSKEVYQHDINGNFLKKYGSVRDAGRETKINQSSIAKCANKKPNYRTAGGFIWKYAI